MGRVVLIVDDLPDIRHPLRRMLRAHGWHVVEAEDVAGALERMGGGVAFDAIVTDWKMPGLEDDDSPPGRQVLALGNAGQPPGFRPIPVVLLTGRSDLAGEDRRGFARVVEKLDIATLPEVLEAVCSPRKNGGPGAH